MLVNTEIWSTANAKHINNITEISIYFLQTRIKISFKTGHRYQPFLIMLIVFGYSYKFVYLV